MQLCGPRLNRAVKQIGPWAEVEELAKDEIAEMIADVALFEPNQRRWRAYDQFLQQNAHALNAADRALAQFMADAWFSIFRVAERHATAGLWLEDLLNGDRRIWLMDEGLEASAPGNIIIGMRLFNAGPFHSGFGIVVTPDEETTDIAVSVAASGHGRPFRYSLAATLYGDKLRAEQPLGLADIPLIESLLELQQHCLRDSETSPPRKARKRKLARSNKRQ